MRVRIERHSGCDAIQRTMVDKDHTNLVSNTHVYPPSIAVNFCLFL